MEINPTTSTENLRAWFFYGLMHPQRHYALVERIPVSRLVSSNFQEIDLTDPMVARLGFLANDQAFSNHMPLGELRNRLLDACSPKNIAQPNHKLALEEMLSSFGADESSWKSMRSLWAFLSEISLPNKYCVNFPPNFDTQSALLEKPRYEVSGTLFQACGDYDEITGEDIYVLNPAGGQFFTDNLDRAIAEINPFGQRVIANLIEDQWDGTCRMRFVTVQENGLPIAEIFFEWRDNFRESNNLGMIDHPIDFKRSVVDLSNSRLVSAIRKNFGQACFDRFKEQQFSRDVGL